MYVRKGWKFFTSFYVTAACCGNFLENFFIGCQIREPPWTVVKL